MKNTILFVLLLSLVSIMSLIACRQSANVGAQSQAKTDQTAGQSKPSDDVFDGVKVVKTDAEWKKILTREQFYILREDGTDYAYRSQYHDNKKEGEYYCSACNLKLFSSAHKYDSQTGWPSFYQPVNARNVVEKEDRSLGEVRTEVECARCGGHLGHVFDDGPEPTGLRYCINGTSLKFVKAK